MQYKNAIIAAALTSTALAAYDPAEPWHTLTPTATYQNAISNYVSTFGIAVQGVPTTATVPTATATATANVKRDVKGSTTVLSPATTSTATSSTSAATASAFSFPDDPVTAETCRTNGTLAITLDDGVIRDAHGRIGSIVANRQFQFDGPPPQAGAIYAGGWSLTADGNLALGDSDIFYQCLSGNFYNLYDEKIGEQCHAVYLQAIDLIEC